MKSISATIIGSLALAGMFAMGATASAQQMRPAANESARPATAPSESARRPAAPVLLSVEIVNEPRDGEPAKARPLPAAPTGVEPAHARVER